MKEMERLSFSGRLPGEERHDLLQKQTPSASAQTDTPAQHFIQLSPLHYQMLRLFGNESVAPHSTSQGCLWSPPFWGQPAEAGAHLLSSPSQPLPQPVPASPLVFYCSPINALNSPWVANRDSASSHPLFFHGFCQWPGCEELFEEYRDFLVHLNNSHCLDERSTAQCLIQKEKVYQLEQKLVVEKGRLLAMRTQLRVKHSELDSQKTGEAGASVVCEESRAGAIDNGKPWTQVWDKHSPLYPDVSSNLEYYRVYNTRPPFTYAALIRWAILETSEKQMTLNEIYLWFTRKFAFFRNNTATWKNAVRHNLSLHKCFVRVENVRGAVWTVDETEFQRRKSPKITRDFRMRWEAH